MPPFFRSIRFRIASMFLLWTCLVQVCVTLLVVAVREVYVIREADHRLAGIAAELKHSLEQSKVPAELMVAEAEQLMVRRGEVDRAFFRLHDSTGRLIGVSQHPAGTELFSAPTVAGNGSNTTVTLACQTPHDDPPSRPHRARVTSVAVAAGTDGAPVCLEVGLSLATHDAVRQALNRVLTVALLIGAVGAGALGWVVSGVVTGRIDRIARAIREVCPTRLDARVDIPAGGDEIGRMSEDLNQLLRSLASVFHGQERFMSEVSHELKTPLAALLTEAQVLKYARTEDERHHKFVLSVEEEMRRLNKIVESFLMLARLGHGRQYFSAGAVAMNDVALDAVEHASLLAGQAGVTVSLNLHDPGASGPEAIVHGDAELLRIVADNLLRNAIQFSKRDDRILVRVTCDGPHVWLSVLDQGPGVPQEYIERIFDRFAQAPSRNGTRRGTGMGLAIARGIIDLHEGTISAENHPERGCIFTVRLRRTTADESRDSGREPLPRAASAPLQTA